MSALTGRSALITGGGSGIGLACARAFLRDGAHVLLFGRDAARLARASAQLRDEAPDQARVLTHAGDVADEADVIAAIDQLLNATGRVDIGIANAGTGTLGPLVATTDAQPRAKPRLEQMFKYFVAAYDEDIATLEWMNVSTASTRRPRRSIIFSSPKILSSR